MVVHGHSLVEELFSTLTCCHHHARHLMAKDYRWLHQGQIDLLDVSGAEPANFNPNEHFALADFRHRYSFNFYLGFSTPYTGFHFSREVSCFHQAFSLGPIPVLILDFRF
jgi:hypothetical protein